MSSEQEAVLRKLRAISEIDAKLAAIAAERRSLEARAKEKLDKRSSAKLESDRSTRDYEERRSVYTREEKRLKDAQHKLVDRRKALTTLGSYKLQMAAEREIDAAAKQLGAQEEQLLTMLEQIEQYENAAKNAQAAFAEAERQYQEVQKDVQETLATLDARAAEYTQERNAVLPEIDERNRELYERVKQRYPMDPVVPLSQNTCGGCFMELGPQTAVEISRGRSLVRCRACGRILFLPPAEE